MAARGISLKVLGSLLFAVGGVLTLGGARLIGLGGSAYYALSGIATLIAAVLIWRDRRSGFRLYLATFAVTVIWALAEVGFGFWLLVPRLGVPLFLALLVLLAMYRRAGSGATSGAAGVVVRAPGGTAIIAILCAVAAMAFLYGRAAHTGTSTPDASRTRHATDEEWRAYGRTNAGTRYAPAADITPGNVHRLQVAWRYRTGDLPEAYPEGRSAYSFEATPLEVGDTLYLCTPHDIVIALEADTGRERWRFDPKIDTAGTFMLTCRGVAYHEARVPVAECPRRILVATLDGRLIALDAATGARCEGFGRDGEVSLREGLGPIKAGYYLVTSPPTIVGDSAIVGGFVLDNMAVDEPPGVVRAYDVRSGEQRWAWDAGRPATAGPWRAGELYTRGAPNAWSLFSADEGLGLVYVPTGNATPDHYGGHRSEALGRHASSVVALDAATGSLRWAFQTVHHDLWDYDVASQPVLVDLPIEGETVPALIQPTKQGEIFLLDRRTGKLLAPVEEQAVPRGDVPGERYSPTQPASIGMPGFTPAPLTEADMWGATMFDQLWCRIAFRKLRYDGKFTPPGLDASLEYPGNNGIMNWGSVAVDEARQRMVVSTSYMPLLLRLIPRAQAPAGEGISIEGNAAISPQLGTPFAVRTERPFASPLGIPCNAPPWGRLSAVDLESRKLLWQRPLGTTRDHAPFGIAVPGAFAQGGAIVTGGGVIFIAAALDNYLRAFDLASGEELWKGRLPAGGQATPMSYVSARTGKQYVVIAAGGHQYMRTTIGDYVIAYSLPDVRSE
ncbi:MAG: Quinate/shikimate dehydrogenase (quinone) [Steroidobacteraceae bacterium]|nr:Quinate/shikimate dehydrogenase (quinone) [Steroidobacteraceae bacterium]